jgi:hypothetical protein
VPEMRRMRQAQGCADDRTSTRWQLFLQYLCVLVARWMTRVDPLYLTIVCRHCEHSLPWPAGKEYPDRCPQLRCQELGDWHAAKVDELTIFDRRLLRSLRIARDEPWLPEKR